MDKTQITAQILINEMYFKQSVESDENELKYIEEHLNSKLMEEFLNNIKKDKSYIFRLRDFRHEKEGDFLNIKFTKYAEMGELVTCKDCKWAFKSPESTNLPCGWFCRNWCTGTEPDGFCFKAIKREVEDD